MMKSKPKDSKLRGPKIQKTDELVPPDGHFGWIIVISYAIANVNEKFIKQRSSFYSKLCLHILSYQEKMVIRISSSISLK